MFSYNSFHDSGDFNIYFLRKFSLPSIYNFRHNIITLSAELQFFLYEATDIMESWQNKKSATLILVASHYVSQQQFSLNFLSSGVLPALIGNQLPMFRDQLSVHLQGLCIHLEEEDWPHTNNRLQSILLLLHYILHSPPLPEEFILSRLELFKSLLMDLPPCQNYFRITIMFELVAAKILHSLCQRIITARSPIRPTWGILNGSLDTELNTTQTYFLGQALHNFAFSEPRADAWFLSTSCPPRWQNLAGRKRVPEGFLSGSPYLTRIHL